LPGDHLNRITDYTPVVMAVDKQSGLHETGSVAPTLKTDLSHDMGPVVAFTRRQYGSYEEAPSVDATLGARDHAAQNTDLVLGYAIAGHAEYVEGRPTLRASGGDIGGGSEAVVIAGTRASPHKDYNSLQSITHMQVQSSGRPRRLTPLECERLMGWPDGWTDVPDEKGKPASDSARYKACGNGVATPVAHWIALRLRDAIAAMAVQSEAA
jgi:DNA (cytosine-5)-methyltransferase 1